jgi:preprotein translocase subunit SecG
MKSDPHGTSVFLFVASLIAAWIFCLVTVFPKISPTQEQLMVMTQTAAQPTEMVEVVQALVEVTPVPQIKPETSDSRQFNAAMTIMVPVLFFVLVVVLAGLSRRN